MSTGVYLTGNDEVDHSPQLKTTTVNNGTTSHTTVVEDKPKQSIDGKNDGIIILFVGFTCTCII